MADKHYAGRWICQRPLEVCTGMIRPYGQLVPCPLAHVCQGLTHPRDRQGQLETLYPRSGYGLLRVSSSPHWDREHRARYRAALQAFAPERISAGHKAYWAKYGDQINAERRVKRQNAAAGKVRQQYTLPPPPCGGDCENCPWDDGCRYPGWDEQHQPTKNQRAYQARKQRMAEDPQYRAKRAAAKKAAEEKSKQRMAVDPEYAAKIKAQRHEIYMRRREKVAAQKKQKMETAPEYAELIRQRAREATRKYRAKKRQEGCK